MILLLDNQASHSLRVYHDFDISYPIEEVYLHSKIRVVKVNQVGSSYNLFNNYIKFSKILY